MRGLTFTIFAVQLALVSGIALAETTTPTAAETTTAVARAPAPTEATPLAGCATADCHANVKQYAALHGPADSDTCDACHQLVDPATHTFRIWREKGELCTFCHEPDRDLMPVVHKPVQTGECLGCHNPHGGTTTSYLREKTIAGTCARCHDSSTMQGQFTHKPVRDGDCDSCHQPHASKFPNLVDVTGAEFCLFCHEEVKKEMSAAKFDHKALEDGCVQCHDVHASDYPKLVAQPVTEMCIGCHEAIATELNQPVQHPAAMGDRACITCHAPHGGNLPSLMADTPRDVCMSCHAEPIKNAQGKVTVAAMTELVDPAAQAHGPIRDGQCGGCHTIHGGERQMLLRKVNTPWFYQAFSTDSYEMCFDCHDPVLVEEDDRDAGLARTKFRNGDVNMHYVHVSRDERGRNCRVCHATHASSQPQIIRNDVRFGKWKLPIVFTRTETGGTCTSGCHRDKPYDRETPVPGTVASTRPVGPSSRPAADGPLLAQWTDEDAAGRELVIPDPERPSILVFVRPRQAQVSQVMEKIAAAVPDGGRAQMVVVMNGQQSDDDVRDLGRVVAAAGGAHAERWRIVTDPDFRLSRALGVQVWPATMVVATDATVVAHMTGASLTLTPDVAAYVDLAEGKVDRTGLAARLAQHGVVEPATARPTGWYLQMAARRYREGAYTAAAALVAEGLKVTPDDVPLRVAMIDLQIELKQGTQARVLLGQLPADALEAWERKLLQAKVAVAQSLHGEARRLLLEVVAERPERGDAQLLLGQLYERESDWPHAARAYRAATEHPVNIPAWPAAAER